MKNLVSSRSAVNELLQLAKGHAEAGRFTEMLAVCRELQTRQGLDLAALLDTSVLLLNFGFLGAAADVLEQARLLAPDDLRAQINLASLSNAAGRHSESRRHYSRLLTMLPDHPFIRRSALTTLEYDPTATDAERLAQARDWGLWALARAGGSRPRPAMRRAEGRRLRIGYVSADLCQHTVGLFVKNVLQAHDPALVEVFTYHAGPITDWVTLEIANTSILHEVHHFNDDALAAQIETDRIDVLVDLSGHTAGSRLTVFARRPAPVQVSWLGYFATTGLPCIDAVLLDEWHAPVGTEAHFVEEIVRLPQGRLCYRPVPWTPEELEPSAFINKGYVTFGSFNNTGKLNETVYEVWAQILASVPDSHLLLKWRTLNDQGLRRQIWDSFARRGIPPERIQLEGPSHHADMLREYSNLDIALDPFPFSGGMTSCEALWMGVPLVTWPQSRVVSRQGFALLSSIGLPELVAKNADDYVRIASELATDKGKLASIRATLRARMLQSSLMDAEGFARQLEDLFLALHTRIAAEEAMNTKPHKSLLHVGSGHPESGAKLPEFFLDGGWKEIRLDMDPENIPDIIGSMLDMADVREGSVDGIYSAHNIEHIHTHEVPQVLAEFLRVLKSDGIVVLTCPDLQAVCQLVVEDKLDRAAYISPAGPITPLDILFGHSTALAAGHSYMAHKTGFTLTSLTRALTTAGFQAVAGKRRERALDLWVVATKAPTAESVLRALANAVLPP